MNAILDGVPLTTGVSVFVNVDGGTQAAGGGTLTHEGNGAWNYVPTQAETNGDHIAFTFIHALGVASTLNVYTVSYDPHDVAGLGLSRLDAAMSTRAAPGDAMALTSGERDSVATALLDLSNGVETSYTMRQVLRLVSALLLGKASGGAGASVYRDMGDTKNRVTTVADSSGNRTTMTLDAT